MKIYFLSAIQAGFDLFSILNASLKTEGYIGLSTKKDRKEVAGYFNARSEVEKKNVKYFEVDSYNLSSDSDRTLLQSLEIDVLIVAGWQRLIPEWLIKQSKIAVGAHGSPLGINKGRGRSPQNWAILMGMGHFEISIFKIDKGIDSGDIISSTRFDYHSSDDIRTSYIKATYCTASLLLEAIKNGRLFESHIRQAEDDPEYLPQRTSEDGKIDWRRSSEEIYDFIRAQTKPYPGSYTEFEGQRLTIWRAVPFQHIKSDENYLAGEVIHVFSGNEMLVKCGKGALIVTEYEGIPLLESQGKKVIFDSANFIEQMEKIRRRHYEKFPDLPLSQKLLNES